MKKKILLVSLLALTITSLTACSNTNTNKKTLTCTKEVNNTGVTIKNTNTIVFKEKKLSNMTMKYQYILKEKYIDSANSIKKSIDKQFEEYQEYKGISYESKLVSNKEIDYQIDIDINKTDEKTKEKFNISGDASYNTNKEALENAGFSCK